MTVSTDQANRDAYIDLVKRSVSNCVYLGEQYSFEEFSSIRHYDTKTSRWKIDAFSRPMTLLALDQLDLIEEVIVTLEKNNIPGDYIEAGVWKGGVIIFMRALINAYNIKNRKVIAADSFQGIPPSTHYSKDSVDKWSDRWVASFEEVKQSIQRYGLLDDKIEFVVGYFSQSLKALSDRTFALLRLDSDSYESISTSLQHLYPRLSLGGIVIVDDWHLHGCKRAVIEYRALNKIGGSMSIRSGNAYWVKE
jgi:O-methyltransferase